ncbi:hypothetical protein CF319_g2703 [Tilletia indica]|uniref:EXPERA domain-containing protein n=1 Tax=Tilletia indica TaxID=43049 RepID=A0A177TWW0_9BASI|nr:hypothetical protein CF319_g2703 [Tilletia indica]KAE8259314.1 hypothetical protein A4X13_0g1100 [Tilletia indica]
MPTTRSSSANSAAVAKADRIHQPRTWITLWLALSSILVLWDCGYMLLRPHSMRGGKFFALWQPYELYGTIDKIYGVDAFTAKEGFPAAQSIMNIPETILNYLYVYIVLFSTSSHARAVAPLIGFTATVMTASKTILYMLVEMSCGYCKVGHNDLYSLVVLFLIPNTPWIFVPTAIAISLGYEIAGNLKAAAGLPVSSNKVKRS